MRRVVGYSAAAALGVVTLFAVAAASANVAFGMGETCGKLRCDLDELFKADVHAVRLHKALYEWAVSSKPGPTP